MAFLKYAATDFKFCGPVFRQPVLPWQPFCALLVGIVLMLALSVNLIRPPSTELLQLFTEYVT